MRKIFLIVLVILCCGDIADNDPTIRPEEIIAPEMESDDVAWVPLYLLFENPDSVDCGGRSDCMNALENATEESV